ncbi:glycosyltransferase family 9 protein [Falsiroseomonas sp. CW058]|uniref:glycosyltransferase family 9 protein n=1 Tax=Falsiroseomonas sp. CW058 TaxID=3388664 RepID=UPI003D315EE8
MRILFVTATRIGDAVLSTALLGHLLARHPGARVTVACGPAAAGVFARMPGLERLIVVAKRRWSLHWLDLWRQVAFTRWDLVVDLRASALAWTVPARRRAVGRGGRRAGHRLTHIGAVLGLSPPPLPVAWTAPEDEARAAALLPGGPWLVLGPTANWAEKVWPADRFVAAARALTAPGGALAGARIAVLGGPGGAERASAAPVLAALPGAVDLVGTLDLPVVAAVLRRAALYLGNDSGLMHLAAAAGAPVVGLFGQSDPREYGPCGPRAVAVQADGEPFRTTMAALPVDRAVAAAEALLRREAAA